MADPADFDKIVDDLTPRREALDWAIVEVSAGRPFDQVQSELLGNDWSSEDADLIVEEARQSTRSLRGVTTRDEIVADANRRYRQSMRPSWFMGMPTWAALVRLLHSVGTLLMLKRRGKSQKDDAPPG